MPHYQSAQETVVDAATLLLADIAAHRADTFTGTGIVFYEDLRGLPHLQLSDGQTRQAPPEMFVGELSSNLRNLAARSSAWHDGFHFVRASDFQLTHIAQFVSPPIPHDLTHAHGKGARFMAALLSSLVPGIFCVGLVSNEGQAILFESGAAIQVNTP